MPKKNNLEDLVPPVEMCKTVYKTAPEAFAGSVFVWTYSCDKRIKEPFVDRREDIEFCRRDMVNAPSVYPAPTLVEIMDKLPRLVEYRWYEDGFYPSHPKFYAGDFADKNAAAAAMKLWLRIREKELRKNER